MRGGVRVFACFALDAGRAAVAIIVGLPSSAFYTRRGVLWGVCAGNTGFARCRCVVISVCCARGAVGARSTRHVRVLADGAVVATSSLVRKLHVCAGAAALAFCGRVIIVIRLSGGTINAGRCRFLSIAARMAVSARSVLRSHGRVLAGGAVHAGRAAVGRGRVADPGRVRRMPGLRGRRPRAGRGRGARRPCVRLPASTRCLPVNSCRRAHGRAAWRAVCSHPDIVRRKCVPVRGLFSNKT